MTSARNLAALASSIAPVASPVFTGDPKAPTPSPGDNDTSLATTAFVAAAIASGSVGGVMDRQVFTTPGTATWTKPANTKATDIVRVELWNGGESGRSYRANSSGPVAQGGDGGCFILAEFKAGDVGATETITVGAGGESAVQSATGFSGPNAGGASSFGSLISTADLDILDQKSKPILLECEPGGSGGTGSTSGGNTSKAGAGGAGMTQTSGTVGTSKIGGSGGAAAATAGAGSAPGGGGGGAFGVSGTIRSGAGARGEVRVTVIR